MADAGNLATAAAMEGGRLNGGGGNGGARLGGSGGSGGGGSDGEGEMQERRQLGSPCSMVACAVIRSGMTVAGGARGTKRFEYRARCPSLSQLGRLLRFRALQTGSEPCSERGSEPCKLPMLN